MSDFNFDPDAFEASLRNTHGIEITPNKSDDDLTRYLKKMSFVPETVKWLKEHDFQRTGYHAWKKERDVGKDMWQMRVDPRGAPRKKNLPYSISVVHQPEREGLYLIKHEQLIYDPYVKGMEQLEQAHEIFLEYIRGTNDLANFDF